MAERPSTRAPRGRGVRGPAARLLARVARGGFADHLLEKALPAVPDPRDRALLTELVYGTLRWQGRLDHVLAAFARRPLKSLHPEVLAALRLAAYQLLVLDRVPAHAAVDEAVAHVKRVVPAAAGFANALLRRVAAEGRTVPLPEDPILRLAVETSHPPWLVERAVLEHGQAEARRRLLAEMAPAPLVLRARLGRERLLARLAGAGVAARPGRVAPDAVVVEAGALPPGGVAALPGFEEGEFAVQDEASQLVAGLLDPPPGARVLDACAAPGGKAGHLADLAGPTGRVVALDVDPERLERVRETVARLRLGDRVTVALHDATRPVPGGPFDAVLVDAPCSGLGVVRRNPDILWRRGPEDIPALAERQRRILAAVAGAVAPGGRLVYAVCTTTAEEGPGVVEGFLASHPEFVADTRLVTHPADGGLDGFFVQRMRRAGRAGSAAACVLPSPGERRDGMAQVDTRMVSLATGAGAYEAKPAGEGPFPAVVVIHEWWGLNDHIKDVARRLAAEGYVALAPDLYHGIVTTDPNEAGRLMGALKADAAVRDMQAAVDFLAGQPSVRADRIGATGFCMGGRLALLAAANDARVKAAAGWYGVPVPDDATLKRIKAEVLYIYGDQDPFVPMSEVKRLEAALKGGGVKGRVVTYPAPHAFFNDTRPEVYQPQHAKDAWGKVLDLFTRTLKA